MLTIDLRKLGGITAEDETYLSTLIAAACYENEIKHYLSLAAKEDFGWANGCLMPYVLANLMTLSSSRVNDFLSSGEWLCGIFNCDNILSVEHQRIMMSFINPYVSIDMIGKNIYVTGKSAWDDARSPLKYILDLLDDAILNNNLIHIISPILIPINPNEKLEDLNHLPLDILRTKISIKWNE